MKSEITPSLSGLIAVKPTGVLPSIFFASMPTASTFLFAPLSSLITTTDGSSRTIPLPFIYMSVFAVPKSIEISVENIPAICFMKFNI